MTLEEMRQHQWVVSWSGGKDSTATILLMREHNVPIKEIIYVRMLYDDILPATLPIMTDFVDRRKKVFESWGLHVRMVYPSVTAKQLMEAKYQRSKYPDKNGKPYGITAFSRGMCKLETPKENAIHKAIPKDSMQMIGYAADEIERHKKLGGNKQSIMVALGIAEEQTYDICRKYDLLSPLYELGLTRDGCWFCPNARKAERQYLRENHPELVDKINRSINRYILDSMLKSGRNNWLNDWYREKTEPEQMCWFK